MDEIEEKLCRECKNYSPSHLGKTDPKDGFICIQCYMAEQTKQNKKYKHEEFIRTRLPIISTIIAGVALILAIFN